MYVLMVLVQALQASPLTSFTATFANETLCQSAKTQFVTNAKESGQRVTISAICVPTSR